LRHHGFTTDFDSWLEIRCGHSRERIDLVAAQDPDQWQHLAFAEPTSRDELEAVVAQVCLAEDLVEQVDIDAGGEPIPPDLEEVVKRYDGLFHGLGRTNLVQHRIITPDGVAPIRLKPYRTPFAL